MAKHHEALRQTSEYYLENARVKVAKDVEPDFLRKVKEVKKPPSYRTYMFLREGEINIIISPEFWSSGGVLEAMNINLDRDENHPLHVTPEAKREYAEKFASLVRQLSNQAAST